MISQGKLRRLSLVFLPLIIVSVVLITLGGFDRGINSSTHGIVISAPTEKPKPIYKPIVEPLPPIVDNFPLAASAKSPRDLPFVPPWNEPPKLHVNESTPLFIGFTRNWRLLQQVVVSYITSGWPPEDIYVVENTGVMHSNRDALLGLQNPFYLDHHRLTKILGVNVISTPTLFTFAQLQNFFIYTALERNWTHYWWAHMDTIVVSDEEWAGDTYQSLYMRAVAALQETLKPDWGPLATRWFAYDNLALVRVQAFTEIGSWDTMIPFYMTDCDMHERLWMRGFKIENADAGKVWDVSSSLDDLGLLYKRGPSPVPSTENIQRNSTAYRELLKVLEGLQTAKSVDAGGRNTWQARQRGGQGEPFYRDPEGFERGISMWMEFGRKVFEEKWGRGRCDLRDAGMVEQDAWRVESDWENPEVQLKFQQQRFEEEKERAQKKKKQQVQEQKSLTDGEDAV